MRNRKTTIAVLCGLPGSGKTSFVRDFSQWKPSLNIIHVHYDKIIPRDSNLEEENWKDRRKSILHSVQAYLREDEKPPWLSVEGFNEQHPDVIFIDDNNFLSSMRHEYYQFCRSLEIGFCQIEMKVPLELSLSRNAELRSAEDSISSEAIRRMHSKFESPNPLANHWESSYSFQLDSCGGGDMSSSFDMIQSVLHSSCENPVKDLLSQSNLTADASRSVCNASVVHQADNLLRKKVSASIREIEGGKTKEEMEAKKKLLLNAKREVLEDLKTGYTRVPSEIVRLIGSGSKERASMLEQLSKELDRLLEEKLP